MQTKRVLNKKASLFSTKFREREKECRLVILAPCSQVSLYSLQSRNIHLGIFYIKQVLSIITVTETDSDSS